MGRLMKHWQIGEHVTIHPSARIHVTERLVIGDYGTIHEGCVIEGRDIEIGQELWMLPGAIIGGGSRYERQSSLRAGHYLHLGRDTFINTARPVTIGNEVGLGTRTALYTHGAYLSALDGFPVSFAPISIGDNVWLPGATVNPGVTIGSDVVVAVGSVVTRSIPSGSLAGGTPAKVIHANAYPKPLMGSTLTEFWTRFFRAVEDMGEDLDQVAAQPGRRLRVGKTIFHADSKRVVGPANETTERIRDLLRRYGIRFYSRPGGNGEYVDWP